MRLLHEEVVKLVRNYDIRIKKLSHCKQGPSNIFLIMRAIFKNLMSCSFNLNFGYPPFFLQYPIGLIYIIMKHNNILCQKPAYCEIWLITLPFRSVPLVHSIPCSQTVHIYDFQVSSRIFYPHCLPFPAPLPPPSRCVSAVYCSPLP